MFCRYLERWQLVPDGEEIITPYGQLLPVLAAGMPAMLKVTSLEKRSTALMDWRGGEGAARVLARSDDALLLMERATGGRSLVQVLHDTGDGGEPDRLRGGGQAPRSQSPSSARPYPARRVVQTAGGYGHGSGRCAGSLGESGSRVAGILGR